MYCEHFQLQEKPFSLIPDPTFLHFTSGHRMAYTMLEYGLYEQTGITAITGEIGSGKTTLLKHLLGTTDRADLTIGLLDNYLDSSLKILHWFAFAFHIPHSGKDYITLFNEIQSFLVNQASQGKRVVLIIDEAQNLSEQALEELRLLTNINSSKHFMLQVILIGQPQLRDLLASENLIQFAQRVTSEYHLDNLSWPDTQDYISHRLKVAGATHDIFNEFAMSVIYYHSRGIPRFINTLCDYSLVYGYSIGVKLIDYQTAIKATTGRKIAGIAAGKQSLPSAEELRQTIKAKAGFDIADVV